MWRTEEVSDRWHYTRDGRRLGPVPRERLIELAREGWLAPDDLVWSDGMPDWVPSRSIEWLSGGRLVRQFHDVVEALVAAPRAVKKPASSPTADDDSSPSAPIIDWEQIGVRHLLAASGAFVAALGIAFTAIARSGLALAFTLGGLSLVAAGLHRECGRLLLQAWTNLCEALRALAVRRREARRRVAEQTKRLAEIAEQAPKRPTATNPHAGPPRQPQAVASPPPTTPLPAPGAPQHAGQPASDRRQHDEASPRDERLIEYELPRRRYSPGLAACLSLLLPGLGQLYKGQFFNSIAWFMAVAAGYSALIIPGLILHACCVIGASSGDPWTKGRTVYVSAEEALRRRRSAGGPPLGP